MGQSVRGKLGIRYVPFLFAKDHLDFLVLGIRCALRYR